MYGIDEMKTETKKKMYYKKKKKGWRNMTHFFGTALFVGL